MDYQEFLIAVAADEAAREAERTAPKGPCPVPDTASADDMVACGCGECMDRAMGRNLDEHPISVLRISRRT